MLKSSSKIYGRDAELAALNAWYRSSPRSQCVVVSGPSGSGKEFLARSFFELIGVSPVMIPASQFLTAEGRSLFGRTCMYARDSGVIVPGCLNCPLATVEAINSAICDVTTAAPIVLLGYSRQWEKLGSRTASDEEDGPTRPVNTPVATMTIVTIEIPMSPQIVKALAAERKLHTMTPDFQSGIQALAQNSFSRLVGIMHHCDSIKLPAGSKLNSKVLEFLRQTWMAKTENKNLYDICRDIFTRVMTFEECVASYRMERSLLPLLLHENAPKFLTHAHASHDLFSRGDMIDVFMYYGNEWELELLYVLVVVYGINLMATGEKRSDVEISFTKLLNKTSLKHVYYLSYKRNIPKRRDVYFRPELVRERCKRVYDDHRAKTPQSLERVQRFMAAESWNMKHVHRILKFLDR